MISLPWLATWRVHAPTRQSRQGTSRRATRQRCRARRGRVSRAYRGRRAASSSGTSPPACHRPYATALRAAGRGGGRCGTCRRRAPGRDGMACSTPRRRRCSCRVRTRWCQSPWTAVRCVSFLQCRVESAGVDALLVKVLGIAGFGRVAAFDTTLECFGPLLRSCLTDLQGNVKQGQNSPTYKGPFSTGPSRLNQPRGVRTPQKAQLESQRRDFKIS